MQDLVQQIERAFARDAMRAALPVYSSDELPLSHEAITTEWLTDALCKGIYGAQVVALDLGPDDNGSSNRRKIRVTYNGAGMAAHLPSKLFGKATHGLANRFVLGVSGAAASEVNFYSRIRRHLAIDAPSCHFARIDTESFNSLVILDDISDDVTAFCDHRTVMNKARAESQMRLLGQLHGAAYSKPQIRAELGAFTTWPDYFRNTLGFGMKVGSEIGFQDAVDVIPPRLFARTAEIWPKTESSVARHAALPHTLAHGDVHLKHWYVAGNGEMGLSDWQCCSRAHWSRDFAYTISTALTIEDRRAWEQDLLKLYLAELKAHGGPDTTFDEGWLHYRQQLMTALTGWTITLHPAPGMPDMQPRDVTLAFVERIATAMDDVGTLDAFD